MSDKEILPNWELVIYRLEQIERKIDVMREDYVTKDEFEIFQDNIRPELKRKGFANWVNPIIAALSTSIVTFLIIYFFNNINR